jgi:GTP-binding protein
MLSIRLNHRFQRQFVHERKRILQQVASGSRSLAGGRKNPEHQRKNIKAALIEKHKQFENGGPQKPTKSQYRRSSFISTPRKQIRPQLPPKSLIPKRTDKAKEPPPLFLKATASKFVFAASTLMEDFEVDPGSLFAEIVQDSRPPPLFRSGSFEYFTPKILNFELPSPKIPQVAVLGRSNVGKSSLLNAIMRRELALCSKHPGRTQQVQYFGLIPNSTNKNKVLDPKKVTGFLVDLPGYGYADAPDENVDTWQKITQSFLQERNSAGCLKRLLLLVDARRGASQLDRDVMVWMEEAEISYSIVLTKVDRVSRPQLIRHANELCMRYHSQSRGDDEVSYQSPLVHLTSSKSGEGIPELLSSLETEFFNIVEDSGNAELEVD